MTKQISEERLRNTRTWAAARPDMSGSEVIVGAIDELIELRSALERLGSMEAFDVSRVPDPEKDAELLARIDFALEALK